MLVRDLEQFVGRLADGIERFPVSAAQCSYNIEL